MSYRLHFNFDVELNCRNEALESSHAIWEAMRIAKTMPKDSDLVVVSHIFIGGTRDG